MSAKAKKNLILKSLFLSVIMRMNLEKSYNMKMLSQLITLITKLNSQLLELPAQGKVRYKCK